MTELARFPRIECGKCERCCIFKLDSCSPSVFFLPLHCYRCILQMARAARVSALPRPSPLLQLQLFPQRSKRFGEASPELPKVRNWERGGLWKMPYKACGDVAGRDPLRLRSGQAFDCGCASRLRTTTSAQDDKGRNSRIRRKVNLTLAYRGCAAQRIDIPERRIHGEVLHSHFPGHFGAGLAAPHDAELRFGAQVQNVNHLSWLQLGVYALQGSAASADGAQASRLGEGTGMSVHTPDLDGKVNENARLKAPIHAMLLGLKSIVGGHGGET